MNYQPAPVNILWPMLLCVGLTQVHLDFPLIWELLLGMGMGYCLLRFVGQINHALNERNRR